jgi:GAF domain-containing protein
MGMALPQRKWSSYKPGESGFRLALDEGVIGEEHVEDVLEESSPSSIPPPLPAWARKDAGPIETFLGALDALDSASPRHAVSICATALFNAFGARAVIVHQHRLATGEIRAISVHGACREELLETRESASDDSIARVVVERLVPRMLRCDPAGLSRAPIRAEVVGAKRSVVAIPVVADGHCIAIFEIYDPREDLAYLLVEAATTLAHHLAAALTSSSPVRTASALRT